MSNENLNNDDTLHNIAEPAPEPHQEPEPTPEPQPEPAPEPQPEPAPEPQPEPAPESEHNPEHEEPAWEEPAWEEPVFDDVTIASVVWPGSQHWDRALYTLSNGKTVFASKGLEASDTPFDYEEIRTSGGGYYEAPSGVVGHTHTRKGGALIIRQENNFKQQQYVWGNQGPVMAPTTQDVTKQIHLIEEREEADMNGDKIIGEPEIEEEEIEVKSVLFDKDGGFDRSIYEMTDQSVVMAEQGLTKGSLPIESEELTNKDGSPIETSGIVGINGLRNGFGILYNTDGSISQLPFKWGNRGPKVSGKRRDITSQVGLIEEREGIDINGDGRIGDQMDEDAEVKSIIYRASRDGFDRSLYKMSNDQFILGEPGLEAGDLPFDSDPMSNADGSPYNADNAVGILGLRRGFAVILKKDQSFSMQQFSWSGRGPKAKGNEKDITKRIYDVENRENTDFTDDGIIGEPYSGKDPEISRVVFPGNDEFEEGLYVMNNGEVVFAEADLEPGDTPFEEEVIIDKSGKPYPGSNVIGIYPIKRGFALVHGTDSAYQEQGFRFSGGGRPKPYGKLRKVKNIEKVEIKANFDINNDGLIGSSTSGNNKDDDFTGEFRLVQSGDDHSFTDSLL